MFLGQVPVRMATPPSTSGTLWVSVIRDGLGVPGVTVRVLYVNGSEDTTETGAEGRALFSFNDERFGAAAVWVEPPPGFSAAPVQTQTLTLSRTPSQAVFSLVREAVVEEEPSTAPMAALGLAAAGLLAWLLFA